MQTPRKILYYSWFHIFYVKAYFVINGLVLDPILLRQIYDSFKHDSCSSNRSKRSPRGTAASLLAGRGNLPSSTLTQQKNLLWDSTSRDFVYKKSFANKNTFCSNSCSSAIGPTGQSPNAANQFQRRRFPASDQMSIISRIHFEQAFRSSCSKT